MKNTILLLLLILVATTTQGQVLVKMSPKVEKSKTEAKPKITSGKTKTSKKNKEYNFIDEEILKGIGTDESSHSYSKGVLKLTSKNGGRSQGFSFDLIDFTKNISLSANIVWLSGIDKEYNKNSNGLVFGSNNSGRKYYKFTISPYGTYSIDGLVNIVNSNVESESIKVKIPCDCINKGSDSNILRIDKKEEKLFFYINNSLVETVSIEIFKGGSFEMTVDGEGSSQFKDIRLIGTKRKK